MAQKLQNVFYWKYRQFRVLEISRDKEMTITHVKWISRTHPVIML